MMPAIMDATDAPELRTALGRARDAAEQPAVRAYFNRVLELGDIDLVRWFETSDQAPGLPHGPHASGAGRVVWVIIQVCSTVSDVITIYNEATKQWEKQRVEVEKCKDVRVPVPEPAPPPGPAPTD